MRKITDNRLKMPENAFILVPANLSVRQALQRWQTAQTPWGAPQEWWWLIIEHGDEDYRALGLHDLRELVIGVSTITLNTRLLSLPESPADVDPTSDYLHGCIEPRAVSRMMHSDVEASNLALRSPGQMLCVTESGQVVGVINKRPCQQFGSPTKTCHDLLLEDSQA